MCHLIISWIISLFKLGRLLAIDAVEHLQHVPVPVKMQWHVATNRYRTLSTAVGCTRLTTLLSIRSSTSKVRKSVKKVTLLQSYYSHNSLNKQQDNNKISFPEKNNTELPAR